MKGRWGNGLFVCEHACELKEDTASWSLPQYKMCFVVASLRHVFPSPLPLLARMQHELAAHGVSRSLINKLDHAGNALFQRIRGTCRIVPRLGREIARSGLHPAGMKGHGHQATVRVLKVQRPRQPIESCLAGPVGAARDRLLEADAADCRGHHDDLGCTRLALLQEWPESAEYLHGRDGVCLVRVPEVFGRRVCSACERGAVGSIVDQDVDVVDRGIRRGSLECLEDLVCGNSAREVENGHMKPTADAKRHVLRFEAGSGICVADGSDDRGRRSGEECLGEAEAETTVSASDCVNGIASHDACFKNRLLKTRYSDVDDGVVGGRGNVWIKGAAVTIYHQVLLLYSVHQSVILLAVRSTAIVVSARRGGSGLHTRPIVCRIV